VRHVLLTMVLVSACPETTVVHEPPTTVKSTDAGQPEYTFPGCGSLDGPVCPRSETALCAVEFLRSRRSICNLDDDCELMTLKPRCLDLCRPLAVGTEDRDLVQVEAQFEVDRYCHLGPCAEACNGGDAGWAALCRMGFCQALDLNAPDTGPRPAGPDAGRRDAGPADTN